MSAEALVNRLLEDQSGVIVMAVLTPESHQRLLELIPPVHKTVYAHHVTMAYKPDPQTLAYYRTMEGRRIIVPVVAVAVDDKGQAVLVGVESENEHPHITISVAEGIEAKYSNELLASEHAKLEHVNIFNLDAVVTVEPIEETPA